MNERPDVVRLKDQHQDLENAINEERGRPHPDDAVISALKKQKLRIQDEIRRLSQT